MILEEHLFVHISVWQKIHSRGIIEQESKTITNHLPQVSKLGRQTMMQDKLEVEHLVQFYGYGVHFVRLHDFPIKVA